MHYLKDITAADFRHCSVIVESILLERVGPWYLCYLELKRSMVINYPEKYWYMATTSLLTHFISL